MSVAGAVVRPAGTPARPAGTPLRPGTTAARSATKVDKAAAKAAARAAKSPRPLPVPALPLFIAAGAVLVLFALNLVNGIFFRIGAIAELALLAVAGADIAISLGAGWKVTAAFPPHVALRIGRPGELSCEIVNSGSVAERLVLRLDLGDDWQRLAEPALITLKADESAHAVWRLRPIRRGTVSWTRLHVRSRSRLGLFMVQRVLPVALTASVLPDIDCAAGTGRARRTKLMSLSGNHLSLRRGGESELDYLREYQVDDDAKRIDWKASKRVGKPVIKVLRSETARPVTLLLDCGRLMTAEEDGLSALDWAVNALIQLAATALEMGDTVRVVAFSDRILGELAPVRGRSGLRAVADFLSKLEPECVEPNYELVLDWFARGQKRRSLVVMVTDMADAINYELFRTRFGLLSRRHQPLLVFTRDRSVEELAAARGAFDPLEPESEYACACARETLMARRRAIDLLGRRGIPVLDLTPGQLSGALVERYLDLKSRSRF